MLVAQATEQRAQAAAVLALWAAIVPLVSLVAEALVRQVTLRCLLRRALELMLVGHDTSLGAAAGLQPPLETAGTEAEGPVQQTRYRQLPEQLIQVAVAVAGLAPSLRQTEALAL